MKRVAVLGGGPAGAMAAERLASAGVETVVFDEKLAWEKPCGGGLTYKAYQRYPFLIQNDTPKRLIHDVTLAAGGAGAATLRLREPLLIYSRLDLNRLMLERAERAGARIERARVLEIAPGGRRWQVRTAAGSLDADFCIVATGARNPLRNVGTQLTAADSMTALGYYIPRDQPHIEVVFPPRFEGYLWVFPRCGHLSVGICGKRISAQQLRARLERFIAERGLPMRDARFYSHLLPALDSASWRANRVAGDGWLAVGDAAGLVDPITGEGLYYALRSGDLASQAILSGGGAASARYRTLLAEDFAADLAFAAALARRVYLGTFLFRPVPQRMVQFTRWSARFRDIMQDLFAGLQPYAGLKKRLVSGIFGTFFEIGLTLSRLTSKTAA